MTQAYAHTPTPTPEAERDCRDPHIQTIAEQLLNTMRKNPHLHNISNTSFTTSLDADEASDIISLKNSSTENNTTKLLGGLLSIKQE